MKYQNLWGINSKRNKKKKKSGLPIYSLLKRLRSPQVIFQTEVGVWNDCQVDHYFKITVLMEERNSIRIHNEITVERFSESIQITKTSIYKGWSGPEWPKKSYSRNKDFKFLQWPYIDSHIQTINKHPPSLKKRTKQRTRHLRFLLRTVFHSRVI